MQWLVVSVRLAAEPSRHRVAVWRELRKTGAVSLGQGSWAVPDVPGVAPGMAKARELAARGDGQLVVLQGTGRDAADAALLRNAFTAQRDDEWTEFIADCGKFDAEIDREIAKQKLTMAELEEEEAWIGCGAGIAISPSVASSEHRRPPPATSGSRTASTVDGIHRAGLPGAASVLNQCSARLGRGTSTRSTDWSTPSSMARRPDDRGGEPWI